jgi:hypothetical protein
VASGHGFKHGPVMGEMVAGAVLGAKIPPTEMGLARLLGITPGSAEFNMAGSETSKFILYS